MTGPGCSEVRVLPHGVAPSVTIVACESPVRYEVDSAPACESHLVRALKTALSKAGGGPVSVRRIAD